MRQKSAGTISSSLVAANGLGCVISLLIVLTLGWTLVFELVFENPALLILTAFVGLAIGRSRSLPPATGLLIGNGVVMTSYIVISFSFALSTGNALLIWVMASSLVFGSGLILGSLLRVRPSIRATGS